MLAASLFESAGSVLCIGAHPDDIEIGCGGTMLALRKNHPDIDVRWVVLTGTSERRAEASMSSGRFLGDASRVLLHGFRDGHVPYDDPAAVKAALVDARDAGDADVVFVPRTRDAHQDHRFLGELAWQVFRRHTILHYEIPKYEGDLGDANVYVPFDQELARRKIDHLFDVYQSQRDKPWFDRELFLGLMRLRGVEAGAATGYAEAFFAPKLILR